MFLNRAVRMFIGAIAACLMVFAQDAERVLRTSVSLATALASRPVSAERKEEVRKLADAARDAREKKDYAAATRLYAQAFAELDEKPWSPAQEYASSLWVEPEYAIPSPGMNLGIVCERQYVASRTVDRAVAAVLKLRSVDDDEGVELARIDSVRAIDDDPRIPVRVPATATGDMWIDVEFFDGESSLAKRSLPIRVEKGLREEVDQFRARLKEAKKKDPTAEYAVAFFERADRSEMSPHKIDFRKELQEAGQILNAVSRNRDPFAGRTGDIRRAYRSKVDQSLEPYRYFIPAAYSPSREWPLLVALHGMGGNENSFFDRYSDGVIRSQAERRGFVVVCPNGRSPASMYRGPAEQDVLDVIKEMQKHYRIDNKRIYLMGHSMGAFGTWSIAMAHPEMFAALGPISGGGDPAGMASIKQIPQYVVHGDADATVRVEQSRAMVEAGKKAGATIEYVEVPGGNHIDVVVPQYGPMFDFFKAQSKK